MLLYDLSEPPSPGDDVVELDVTWATKYEITLRANPQNGFLWYLDLNDDNNLVLSHDTMEPLSKYRGTIQHFFFDKVEPGNYNVRFVYKRSWEKTPYATKTFSLSIK